MAIRPEEITSAIKKQLQDLNIETELKEVIVHLAFSAGWPKAMSAVQVAKRAFES